MKKITLILISIILIATLASCDGSVNALVSGKAITFKIISSDNLSSVSFEGDSEITFTTTAETWQDLVGTELGYDVYFTCYSEDFKVENIKFASSSGNIGLSRSTATSRAVSFADSVLSLHIVSSESATDSTYLNYYIQIGDTIEDGQTYYIFCKYPPTD
ncbi:MAG: hypothetical protein K6F82_02805 [Sphaerochaetaceae bacterium]|nr:hypothetical protein [Sphaerochaetaceae bacterium]